MPLQSLGKVTVTTAGTPVQITTTSIPCQGISLQALSANTGKIFVGLAGMNKTTLVGVLGVIAIPSTNTLPSFGASSEVNGVNASSLWIDADNSGEGVLVGYVQQ